MCRYRFSDTTLELLRGDITESDTDAISNAANAMLMGGGGVDGAIHRAAGPELAEALREVKRTLPGGLLETGKAVITPGFNLKARWVIHCVGPIYRREGERAAKLLASCYARAVRLCSEHELKSVAFPSISTGVYGFPVDEAAPVAIETLRETLPQGPELCQMVFADDTTFGAYRAAADRLLG